MKSYNITLKGNIQISIYADEMIETKKSIMFKLNGMLIVNVAISDILSIDC